MTISPNLTENFDQLKMSSEIRSSDQPPMNSDRPKPKFEPKPKVPKFWFKPKPKVRAYRNRKFYEMF